MITFIASVRVANAALTSAIAAYCKNEESAIGMAQQTATDITLARSARLVCLLCVVSSRSFFVFGFPFFGSGPSRKATSKKDRLLRVYMAHFLENHFTTIVCNQSRPHVVWTNWIFIYNFFLAQRVVLPVWLCTGNAQTQVRRLYL